MTKDTDLNNALGTFIGQFMVIVNENNFTAYRGEVGYEENAITCFYFYVLHSKSGGFSGHHET